MRHKLSSIIPSLAALGLAILASCASELIEPEPNQPDSAGSGGSGAHGGRTGSGGSSLGQAGKTQTEPGSGGTSSPDAGITDPADGGSDSTPEDASTPDAPISTDPDAPCPRCVRIFDGQTLDGWEQEPKNSWSVKDGAMNSLGTARGYIATVKDYGDYRLIFKVKQIKGDHQPCVLIYGIRPPPNNALGAIQFQPPNGYTWDYRPGHNNSGSKYFTKYPHPTFTAKEWSRCEALVRESGTFRVACCQVGGDGSGTCKGVEILKFNDPTAGRKGPFAWQMHNSGINDQYKDVWLEVDPEIDDLITTK